MSSLRGAMAPFKRLHLSRSAILDVMSNGGDTVGNVGAEGPVGSSSRSPSAPSPVPAGGDLLTLGRRIRHFRTRRGLTLDQLAEATGSTPSLLSLVENGRREPRISLLGSIAGALGVEVADLLSPEPPSRRAALEIALDQAQRQPLYAGLGLPAVRPGKGLPTEALEALVGLHAELARRANASIATPEEARRANTEIRLWMRERDNHLPEIEDAAEELVHRIGYSGGALTHRAVARLCGLLGFEIIHVNDLPHSTRSVTDLANGRIYLPAASIPGGHGLRALALQAMAHRVLGHERPRQYAEFLRQRLEINYFASACLLPRTEALAFLTAAKREKDLAVEDFRDAFGVTHEAAAHRLTNLATAHLGLPVHFLRVGEDGALYRGYENDGVAFPSDPTGAIEGQTVCRQWTARVAFTRTNRTAEFHQYTDTPQGTFWCSAQTGFGDGRGSSGAGGSGPGEGEFSITFGVPYVHAKWFRGRDTPLRRVSTCPDEACCRRASSELASTWAEKSWPSARMHAQVLAPLPSGTFPGVDDAEVYAFLEKHAPRSGAPGPTT